MGKKKSTSDPPVHEKENENKREHDRDLKEGEPGGSLEEDENIGSRGVVEPPCAVQLR